MKKILIVGAGGQIGSELTVYLRNIYGGSNVVATDMRDKPKTPVVIKSVRVDTLGVEYPAPVKK